MKQASPAESADSSQAGRYSVNCRYPSPPHHMTGVRDFVAGLARAGKSFKEIQETVNGAFGDQALKKTQIYDILKLVKAGKSTSDRRHCSSQKTKRTASLVADIAAAIQADARVGIEDLVRAFGVSHGTIHTVLHEDLGLVKKSARWVPKLLTDVQKEERVRICKQFTAAVRRDSMHRLTKIVTMDETMVSFHTPETKKQSKRWIQKGKPGPMKARVHASRQKQMVLVFFDAKGVIYTNIVPRGQTVNAAYITKALAAFMKNMRTKRPELVSGEWFFHWDNAPVHTAAAVRNWLAARDIQVLPHPPYSPDLAPADFFFFTKMKEQLSGRTLTPESFKTAWEGVARTIAAEEFAAAFRRWYYCCEKCANNGGEYVEKS